MKTLIIISFLIGWLTVSGMEELKEIVPEESSWYWTVVMREAGKLSPKSFEAIIIKALTGINTARSHTTYCLAIEITDSSLAKWEIGQRRVLLVDRWWGGVNPSCDEPFRDGEKIRMLVFGINDGQVYGFFEPLSEQSDNNAQQDE